MDLVYACWEGEDLAASSTKNVSANGDFHNLFIGFSLSLLCQGTIKRLLPFFIYRSIYKIKGTLYLHAYHPIIRFFWLIIVNSFCVLFLLLRDYVNFDYSPLRQ